MLAELFLLVYTTLAITYSPVTDSTFPLAKSLQFGFGVALYLALFSRGTFFNGYLSADAFGTYIKVLTLLTTCYIATRSPYLMRGQEYPLMFALCTLFLLLMVSSHHLLGTFFAIIGFSLCLYILILFDAPYAAAREAGIKYFYLSTFSTGVMLYGIFLLSTLTPSLQYEDIAQALAKTTSHIARFGCFFTLAGFFFKLSAFPGQLWAPDVYEGSPAPVLGYLMLPVKLAVLGALMQLLRVGFSSIEQLSAFALYIAVVGSLLWGCFGALYEMRLRRFLAYASINQMGFLLLGVACNSTDGDRATLLYMFLYSLMSIGFLILFFHLYRLRDNHLLQYVTDFRGLGHASPVIGWVLTVVLFSMAGIPPLAGFFGKYYLLAHAVEQKLYLLVAVGLVTSLISTYYYLRVIKSIWFETDAPRPYCVIPQNDYRLLRGMEALLWGTGLYLAPLFAGLSALCVPPLRRVRPTLAALPLIEPLPLSFATVAGSCVILLANPVHSLLALISAFLCVVVFYLSMQIQFLAFTFLIVYVGAIAILFLFVVMLLNVKELTQEEGKLRWALISLVLPACPLAYAILGPLHVPAPQRSIERFVSAVTEQYQDINVFSLLYSNYLALFILITLILLAAMIGAIVLAGSSVPHPTTAVRTNGFPRPWLKPTKSPNQPAGIGGFKPAPPNTSVKPPYIFVILMILTIVSAFAYGFYNIAQAYEAWKVTDGFWSAKAGSTRGILIRDEIQRGIWENDMLMLWKFTLNFFIGPGCVALIVVWLTRQYTDFILWRNGFLPEPTWTEQVVNQLVPLGVYINNHILMPWTKAAIRKQKRFNARYPLYYEYSPSELMAYFYFVFGVPGVLLSRYFINLAPTWELYIKTWCWVVFVWYVVFRILWYVTWDWGRKKFKVWVEQYKIQETIYGPGYYEAWQEKKPYKRSAAAIKRTRGKKRRISYVRWALRRVRAWLFPWSR